MFLCKHWKNAAIKYRIFSVKKLLLRFTLSAISREFFAPGAPNEINIDGKTMEKTLQDLKSPSR